MGDEDDFRARAMAMYKAKGKTETTEAAKRVKKSVKKEASSQLETDDYRAAAKKLYTLKGPEKLCQDCSSDSGRRGALKKNAYYGLPNDRSLTVADRRRWCKACAQKHEGAIFISAKDDDDDDPMAALSAKISNKTTAMAAKAEKAKQEAAKREAMSEKGMFEAASSSESDFNDWTSSDEDDPEIVARRKRDREIQRRKAEELQKKRRAEEEKTLAGKAKALKEKSKEYLVKEDDPDKPPGEMYIPDSTNPNEPTDGRTFKDALDAKTDAEWERGFLRKQRYWLACCSFCKLCCASWWTFFPVMIVMITDFKCSEVGPDCLMCTKEMPTSSLDQFIAENLDVIQVVNFRGSIEIIQDMNYTGLADCTGEGIEEQCVGATAWPCDVDLNIPGNEGAEGLPCKPKVYVNVSYFGVSQDVTRAIAIDAYLKDRVLRVSVGYDHEEGGWNTGACPEAHVRIVLSNVSSSVPGVGPLLNITLGHNLPKREAMWEPWLGKKMAHKGVIEASFDPGMVFAGVHLTNWVPGGNVSVRGVATTHLAVQAASGNVSILGVDSSSVIALAGDDGHVDISQATLVSMAEITGQVGIEAEMDGVCAGNENLPPCRAPLFFYRDEETFAGMCCMDKHLQRARGFRPHGSLHVSTHMGHITVDQLAGHPSIDLSTIGGSVELLLESATFSGIYELVAPKGRVLLQERRFRTPYQFPPDAMMQLFPNSTGGFQYLALDEAIQLYEEPARRALPVDSPDRRPAVTSPAFPRKGRVLMAGGDGLEVTGDQTLKVSSAEGDVDVCITESVGGVHWGGNLSTVEETMEASGGNPRLYSGPDTEPCKVTLRKWCAAAQKAKLGAAACIQPKTGPSGAGRGADGSEPWFSDRMGGPYHEVIDYCAVPPTHDVPGNFDVDELC